MAFGPVAITSDSVRSGQELPEEFLIARAKEDPEAFAVLYRRHYDAIAGYIYRRTGDSNLTEDLTSETFLSALRAIGNYRIGAVPIRVWLLRIATNAINAWIRGEKGRRRRDGIAGEMRAHAAEGAEVQLDERAKEALLALNSLPSDQQTVIALHHVEGMALEEIAIVMECRVGTVKSRLHRGREAMRERLWSLTSACGERP